MSDEPKSTLGLGDTEPTQTSEDKPSEGETQEELNWRENLSDDLAKDETILKYKTLEDLAKSHVHLQKKLGKVSSIDLGEKHDVDSVTKAFEVLFPEEKVADDIHPQVKKWVENDKFPAKLAEKMNKDLTEYQASVEKEKSATKLAEYKAELKQLNKEGDLERLFNKGLEELDIKFDQIKEELGDQAYNPVFVKGIAKLGASQMSEAHIDINKGKSGGLPSTARELDNLMDSLVQQKLTTIVPSERREIDRQLSEIRAKMTMFQKGSGEKKGLLE